MLAHFTWAQTVEWYISLKFLLETRLNECFGTLVDLLGYRVQKL